MTTENCNKIDMSRDRTPKEWKNLLDSVKVNMNDFLTKDEQSYYVDEITYKITGRRHSKHEVMKSIQEGAADIDDLGL